MLKGLSSKSALNVGNRGLLRSNNGDRSLRVGGDSGRSRSRSDSRSLRLGKTIRSRCRGRSRGGSGSRGWIVERRFGNFESLNFFFRLRLFFFSFSNGLDGLSSFGSGDILRSSNRSNFFHWLRSGLRNRSRLRSGSRSNRLGNNWLRLRNGFSSNWLRLRNRLGLNWLDRLGIVIDRLVLSRSDSLTLSLKSSDKSLGEINRVRTGDLATLSILDDNCDGPGEDVGLLNTELLKNSIVLNIGHVELIVVHFSSDIGV